MRQAMLVSVVCCAAGAMPAVAQDFRLTSSDIEAGATMERSYVYSKCGGANMSPALAWHGAPTGVRSYVVTVFDPDAPTGHGWWHWAVYNLPANTNRLDRNAGDPAAKLLPEGGVEARTDFGTAAYGGPCPPPGVPHHYVFTIYALSVPTLDVATGATAAEVAAAAEGHVLGSATLTALYGRSR